MATKIEFNTLATEERKKQIAEAVKTHREKQKQKTGRKQTPVMLTEEDRENMAEIKKKEPDVNNQGEAISKALSKFVLKYDEK